MGTFKSSRTFSYEIRNLEPVAKDVMDHFEQHGFEATADPIPTGGWQVSVRKGGFFRTVSGLKTALNIKIEPAGNGTSAEAGIGIFGAQAIPTAIFMFVAWPIIFVQIWGLAQNAKLDEEALSIVERSLIAHSSGETDTLEGWLPQEKA